MRVTYDQVKFATDDVIDSGKFNLAFNIIPGNGISETKIVCIKCFTVSLPSDNIDSIEVNIHGHKTYHRGLRNQEKTFSASFYNNGSGVISNVVPPQNGKLNLEKNLINAIKVPIDSYRVFSDWMERVASINTQLSAQKQLITTSLNSYLPTELTSLGLIETSKKNLYTCKEVLVDIYDSSGIIQNRIIFYIFFPIKINVNHLGDYKQPLVTFQCDYWKSLTALELKALGPIDRGESIITNLVSNLLPKLY